VTRISAGSKNWVKVRIPVPEVVLSLNLYPETIPDLPNVLRFDDFQNLAMLLNYSELALITTPSRYNSPCLLNFEQPLYRLPRQCGREIRGWLLENFQLFLDPPVRDGFDDEGRLKALLRKTLLGQAHKLWDDLKRRDELDAFGPVCVIAAKETGDEATQEITANQVLAAILEDLSGTPDFDFSAHWSEQTRNSAPPSYAWPTPPAGSKYVLKCTA
jgi:hypothetical protein